MTSSPDTWVYGDFAPDPASCDLIGLKARWLVEQLPVAESPLVLDYGAGEGKHLHLVRSVKPLARLVGVDIRAPHTAVDFEYRQVAADAPLPFDPDTFDLVISCDVLEHVDRLEWSLDEIRRVLRPGGAFVGFVPAEGGPGVHGFVRIFCPHIYRDTKDHGHAYTRRELLRQFSSRFEVVRLAYSYHLLGATLDAAFFASFKLPVLGRRLEAFWRGQENDVYRARTAPKRRSLANRLVGVANRAAYLESTLLRNVAFGSTGLHFHLRKRAADR
ncbi:MAG TPA: class I SAM-dependent methyltransferase [Steroidobacteraceae bacterium]|nr:class I SAM-dependent methyltransferase [Steroidobacteraceae bacterium]